MTSQKRKRKEEGGGGTFKKIKGKMTSFKIFFMAFKALTQKSIHKSLGSGALNGNILFVGIIENIKLMLFLCQVK